MNLLKETEDYCLHCFAGSDPEKYIYHNLAHTKEVVEASGIIGRKTGLNQEELELVTIAAWFHDIGYTVDFAHHEEESKKIATDFLTAKSMNPEKIRIICECIEATKIPQSPKNKLEEVICDADMYHLSLSNFCERTILLNLEKNKFREEPVSTLEFLNESVQYLTMPYFTDYAKNMWTDLKKRNLEEVNRKILLRKAEKEIGPETTLLPGGGYHVPFNFPQADKPERHCRQQVEYFDYHEYPDHLRGHHLVCQTLSGLSSSNYPGFDPDRRMP